MEEEAQLQTINYDGGSITMVRGALEVFLGANLTNAQWEAEAVSTAVSGHQRVRVIGEPAVSVSAHNRNYNQYPTSNANGAAAEAAELKRLCDPGWQGRQVAWPRGEQQAVRGALPAQPRTGRAEGSPSHRGARRPLLLLGGKLGGHETAADFCLLDARCCLRLSLALT